MEGCKRLEQLPKSIGSLSCLTNLNLSHCDRLANLQIHILEQPSPLESGLQRRKIIVHLPGEINKLSSLVNLSIDGRIHIQLLNLIGDAEHISCIPKQQTPDELLLSRCYVLKSLNIKRTRYNKDGSSFSCISFSDFHSLTELKLINLNILTIPDDIGQLQSLEKLDLSGNDFKSLPTSMTNLSRLKYARLSNCIKLVALPELTQLQTLKLSGCSNLRSLLNLSHAFHERVRYGLLELGLDNCRNFKSLSYQVRQLTSLIHLDLSRHDFEEIPESIRELSSLGTLCLNNCKKIKSVKDLPESLKHLYAHGCDSLENVSLSSNHSIEKLDLSHCFGMKQDEHLITQILNDGFSQVVCFLNNYSLVN
uniref:TMV resistance protein N n=1 Tax=Noccaea caerulescens TaxID=107243 RepID=A0A1J3GQ11_NOCCA